MTTGALPALERELSARHLTSKAAIVEATVDPGRDTPERMTADARLTGVTWPLLTASPATLAGLWHFFGIYYQVVPEGLPPGVDWQTGSPLPTTSITPTGSFCSTLPFVSGSSRRGWSAVPPCRPRCGALLDAQGVNDLQHPCGGSWTVDRPQPIEWALEVAGNDEPRIDPIRGC